MCIFSAIATAMGQGIGILNSWGNIRGNAYGTLVLLVGFLCT